MEVEVRKACRLPLGFCIGEQLVALWVVNFRLWMSRSAPWSDYSRLAALAAATQA